MDQVVKSRLSPGSGSVILRQRNPIHKKGEIVFFNLDKFMQKSYSHINLNLTCKKFIHKSNLTLGHFPFFHFYPLSQKASENGMEIYQMSIFICKIVNFSFRKMSKKRKVFSLFLPFLDFCPGLEIHGNFKRQS